MSVSNMVSFIDCMYALAHTPAGGCGSMYEIDVTSSMFKGRRLVQQHQMVNNVS